ncbi:prolipoprotein diacylglyceryl transferase [Eubacteriales bacterium OttesenSCG-928-K08]|nr:prolipoprotein diacylglyceryl transferase [Eubacteriales bacterium OttesenSCG-928-K08]
MKNPDPVAFEIFGWPIYWYGILIAAGIVLAVLLSMREAKRKNMHEDTLLDLCLVLIPSGVVGARLYYVIFAWEQYAANPISMLYIWEGGLAIFGGIIGGIIGMLIYAKVKKISFLKLADVIAPGVLLAQALGRWGNFFNQEAFGLPVTNPDMLWFPFAVRIDRAHEFVHAGNGLNYVFPNYCPYEFHMATFFYESMWCLLAFAFLWFVLRKRAKHDGDVFLWFVMLYSAERVFVEGLRGDSLMWGSIRVSQLLSGLLFVAILAFFIVRRIKEKQLGRLIWPAPAPEPYAGEMLEDDFVQGEPLFEQKAQSGAWHEETHAEEADAGEEEYAQDYEEEFEFVDEPEEEVEQEEAHEETMDDGKEENEVAQVPLKEDEQQEEENA